MIGILIANALIAVVIAIDNGTQLPARPSTVWVEIQEQELLKHLSTGCKVAPYHILTAVAPTEVQVSALEEENILVIDRFENIFTIEKIVKSNSQGIVLLETHVSVVNCSLFSLPLKWPTYLTPTRPLQLLYENDNQIINVSATSEPTYTTSFIKMGFLYGSSILFHKYPNTPHLGSPIFVESNGTYILPAMFIGFNIPDAIEFNAVNLMSNEFLSFTTIITLFKPDGKSVGPSTVMVTVCQGSLGKMHISIGCQVESGYILTVLHSEVQVSALEIEHISVTDTFKNKITIHQIMERNNQGVLLLKTEKPVINVSSFSLPLVWPSTNAPLELLNKNKNQMINIFENSPYFKYSTSFTKRFLYSGSSMDQEKMPHLGSPIFVESNGTYTLLAMFVGLTANSTINTINLMSDRFRHRFTSLVKAIKPYTQNYLWKETSVVMVEEQIGDQMFTYLGTPHGNVVMIKRKYPKVLGFHKYQKMWVRPSDGLRYLVLYCSEEISNEVDIQILLCVTNLYFNSPLSQSVIPSIENSIIHESIEWPRLNQYNRKPSPNAVVFSTYPLENREGVNLTWRYSTQMWSKFVKTNVEVLTAKERQLKLDIMNKDYTRKSTFKKTIHIFYSFEVDTTCGVLLRNNAILTLMDRSILWGFEIGAVKIYVEDSTGPVFVESILEYNNPDMRTVALVVLITNKINIDRLSNISLTTRDIHAYRILFIPKTLQDGNDTDKPYTIVNIHNSFYRYNTDVISQELAIGMPILGMEGYTPILVGLIEHIYKTESMERSSFRIFKLTSEKRIRFIEEAQWVSQGNLQSTTGTNLMRVIRAGIWEII